MVPLIKINLAKDFEPIEVRHHIVNGRNDMPLSDNSLVEGPHVNTDSDFIWALTVWVQLQLARPKVSGSQRVQ